MLQVPGGHSLAGIPGAGFQRGADFQPPYFPPPFPQQGMEVLSPAQVRFHHETKPLDHLAGPARPLRLQPAQHARLPSDELDPGFWI